MDDNFKLQNDVMTGLHLAYRLRYPSAQPTLAGWLIKMKRDGNDVPRALLDMIGTVFFKFDHKLGRYLPAPFYEPLWIAHDVIGVAHWLSLKGQEDHDIEEAWYVKGTDADGLLAQWDGKPLDSRPAIFDSDDALGEARADEAALPQ